MKPGSYQKPQDLLVLLKLHTGYRDLPWTYAGVAADLKMSQSEIHSAIKRAELAKLYDPLTKRPIRTNLSEFLVSGLKYVYPSKPGEIAMGMLTAHSLPPLAQKLVASDEDVYVWPMKGGKARGRSIEPLYETVPSACKKDPELHQIFGLIDALRVGRTREMEIAKQILREKLGTG